MPVARPFPSTRITASILPDRSQPPTAKDSLRPVGEAASAARADLAASCQRRPDGDGNEPSEACRKWRAAGPTPDFFRPVANPAGTVVRQDKYRSENVVCIQTDISMKGFASRPVACLDPSRSDAAYIAALICEMYRNDSVDKDTFSELDWDNANPVPVEALFDLNEDAPGESSDGKGANCGYSVRYADPTPRRSLRNVDLEKRDPALGSARKPGLTLRTGFLAALPG